MPRKHRQRDASALRFLLSGLLLTTACQQDQQALGGPADLALTEDASGGPAAALGLTAVSPRAWPGSGGIPIVIHGQGFTPGATVTIAGISAEPVTFLSSEQLRATLPPNPTAFGLVEVAVLDSSGAPPARASLFSYSAAALRFPGPVQSGLGSPFTVDSADFNGDGYRDIVVLDNSVGEIKLLLGDAQGGVTPVPGLPTESGGTALAVADFNRDGKADLAVTSGFTNSVRIHLGDGRGGFRSLSSSPVDPLNLTPLVPVLAADLNKDGVPDLAMAVSTTGLNVNAVILLGKGDGTFRAPVKYASGISTMGLLPSLALGDINGDGAIDVEIGFVGSPVVASGVIFFTNRGDGTFSFLSRNILSMTPGLGPRSVALGDLDLDGKLDHVVGLSDGKANSSILLFKGNGAGGFSPWGSPIATDRNDFAITINDLDGDLLPDILVNNPGAATVSIFFGNGSGSFPRLRRLAVGESPVAHVVTDLNQDKKPDLVVANSSSGSINVVLSGPSGLELAPTLPLEQSPQGLNPQGLITADFDGDGGLDFAVGSQDSGLLRVLFRSSGYSINSALMVTLSAPARALVSGDFNRDGVPDLAVAEGNSTIEILLGQRASPFRFQQSLVRVAQLATELTAADMNGDGILDLGLISSDTGNVGVALGDGQGGFTAAGLAATGVLPSAVIAGDFDADRLLDLAVANYGSDSVSILSGDGRGGLRPARSFPAGHNPAALATADWNGDRLPDLAVANALDAAVSLLVSDGAGSFSAPRQFKVGQQPVSLAVGDIDGDLLPDLAVAHGGSNTVGVLLGSGSGLLAPVRQFAADFSPGVIRIADFDQDGRPDVLTLNRPAGVPGFITVLANMSR